MKNNYNFSEFSALTETELTDTIGGGGISDLVVRGLTWLEDHIIVIPAPIPVIIYH